MPHIPFVPSTETSPRYQRRLSDGSLRNSNAVAFFFCEKNLILEIDTDRKDRGQTSKAELSAFGNSVYASDWNHALSLAPEIQGLVKKLRLDEALYPYFARSLFIIAAKLIQRVSLDEVNKEQMNELFQLLVNELVLGNGKVFYVDRNALGLYEMSQTSDTQYFIIDIYTAHNKIAEILNLQTAPSRKSFHFIETEFFLEQVQVTELKDGKRSISIPLPNSLELFDIRPANGFTLLPYIRLRQQHGGIEICLSDDPLEFSQYDPKKMILAQCIQSAYPKEILPPLFMTDITPIMMLLEIVECFPKLNLEDLAFDAVNPEVLLRGTLIQQIILHISGDECLYEEIFNELYQHIKKAMPENGAKLAPSESLIRQQQEAFNLMLPQDFDTSKVHYTFMRLEREHIIEMLASNRVRRISVQEVLTQHVQSVVKDWLKIHPNLILRRNKPDETHHLYISGPVAAGKSSLQTYLEKKLNIPSVEHCIENNPDPYYRLMLGPLLREVSHGLAFGSFNLSICWYMIRIPLLQAVLDAYEAGSEVPNMIWETLNLSGFKVPKKLLDKPGKHTFVVVSADAEDKAVERAILRGNASGRYVASDIVKKSYQNVSKQFVNANEYFDLRDFTKEFLLTENHQLLVCDSSCLYPSPIRLNKNQEETRRSFSGDLRFISAAENTNPIIMILKRNETQILNYPRVLSFLARSGLPVNKDLIENFLTLIPGGQEQKLEFKTKFLQVMNAVPKLQCFFTPYLTRDHHRRRLQSQLADFIFSQHWLVAEGLSLTAQFILNYFDFNQPGLGAYARKSHLNNPQMSGRADIIFNTDEEAVIYLKSQVQRLADLNKETSIEPLALSQCILALYTTARRLEKQESFKSRWEKHSELSGFNPRQEKIVIQLKEKGYNPILRTQTGIQLKKDAEAQPSIDHLPSSLNLTANPKHHRASSYFDTTKRPFVAGPSGHTTYYLFPLCCLQEEMKINKKILRQYLLAIGSMLVWAGAHSFEEVADNAQRFFPELFKDSPNVYQAFLGESLNDAKVLEWIKADRYRMAGIQPPIVKQSYAKNNQRFMRQDEAAFMRQHPGLIANLAAEKAQAFIESWRRRFESELSICIIAQRKTFHPVVVALNQVYIELLEQPNLFPQTHDSYQLAIERFFLNKDYMGSIPRKPKDLKNKETLIQLLKESYLPDDSLMLLHYGFLRYVYEFRPELKEEQTRLLERLKEKALSERGTKTHQKLFDRLSYVPGIILDPDELRDIKPLSQSFINVTGSIASKKAVNSRDLELGLPYVAGPSGHMAMYLIGYQLVITLAKRYAPHLLDALENRKSMQLYFLRWMANLLGSGSHSIHECAQVLTSLQDRYGKAWFPYQKGSYIELLQPLKNYNWFQAFLLDRTHNYQWLMQPHLAEKIDDLLGRCKAPRLDHITPG